MWNGWGIGSSKVRKRDCGLLGKVKSDKWDEVCGRRERKVGVR